jgi:hypothetical protein
VTIIHHPDDPNYRDEVDLRAVHYVRFLRSPRQVDRFVAGPVILAINHPRHPEGSRLSDPTRVILLEQPFGLDRPVSPAPDYEGPGRAERFAPGFNFRIRDHRDGCKAH